MVGFVSRASTKFGRTLPVRRLIEKQVTFLNEVVMPDPSLDDSDSSSDEEDEEDEDDDEGDE